MKFGLARYILGDVGFVEVSKEDYDKLIIAKKCLIEAVCIEEKYDIALNNYFELESELMTICIEKVSLGSYDYNVLFDVKTLINRRVINLLSSCRMYIDQCKAQLSSLANEFSLSRHDICLFFSESFEKYLGYKVMEGVRNFSQHFDLPVEKIQPSLKRDESGGMLSCSIGIFSSVDYYNSAHIINKKTIEEMQKIGKEIDLRQMIREYMAGLSDVHLKLRAGISEKVSHYDTVMGQAIERYAATRADKETLGLCAVITDENSHFVEHNFLLTEWTARRKRFEAKNKLIQNMHLRYVDSRS